VGASSSDANGIDCSRTRRAPLDPARRRPPPARNRPSAGRSAAASPDFAPLRQMHREGAKWAGNFPRCGTGDGFRDKQERGSEQCTPSSGVREKGSVSERRP
jgi:hypothetical protein